MRAGIGFQPHSNPGLNLIFCRHRLVTFSIKEPICFNVPSQNLHWNSVSKVSCSNCVSRLNLTVYWENKWPYLLVEHQMPKVTHPTVTWSYSNQIQLRDIHSGNYASDDLLVQWKVMCLLLTFHDFGVISSHRRGVFSPLLFHNKRQSQRLHSSVKLDSMYSTLICWRSLRRRAVADINLWWLLICCRAASLGCHWVFLLHNELNQRRDGLISLYLSLQLSRVWLSHCSWLVSSVTLQKDFYSRQS